MSASAPVLSKRALEQMAESAKSPVASALGKTFSNVWSETNSNGVINAGLAENSLCHDWLIEFFERKGSMKMDHLDLTYGESILGSKRVLSTLSNFYTRYFDPLSPVKPEHIATMNGLSSCLEHLAAAVSDPGDNWLIPTPYYYAFKEDLMKTSKVGIVGVAIPEGEQGELAEVEACEREMQRRKDEGGSKVTAVIVTNPHNPLGFCYKPEVLLAYCRFAQKWDLWCIFDEIYALGVFEAHDLPSAVPFTSILSLNVEKDAGCNPARIVQLYGASKDFGANGIRAGCLVAQHNPQLLWSLMGNAMVMRMGSPTDILWSALLNSPDLPTYLSLNHGLLSRAYAFFTRWLKAQQLPYRPANAGHFVWCDFRSIVRRTQGVETEEEITVEQEIRLLDALVDGGVYVGPGSGYATSTGYGFFRVTFSIQPRQLVLALERIEKIAGLPSIVKDISAEYLQ